MSLFEDQEIFVFGSNLAGIHGAGSALHARKYYGALQTIGVGLQGHAYAIPTKDRFLRVLSLDTIRGYVDEFLVFARAHPEMQFKIVPIGCGLAGFRPVQMAPLFAKAPHNCSLPQEFREVLDK